RFERGSFREPAPSRLGPQPQFPEALPVIGFAAKSPIANYQAPPAPAIAPFEPVEDKIIALQDRLKAVKAVLPERFQLRVDRYAWAASPLPEARTTQQLVAPYEDVLNLPNTGVAQVASLDPTRSTLVAANRLAPAESTWAPLLTNLPSRAGPTEFQPRLMLEAQGSDIRLSQPGLDFGFMLELGDLPLDALPTTLNPAPFPIDTGIWSFFINYQPPNTLEAVQADRRRFTSGKEAAFNTPVLLSPEAPLALDTTYLLRTIQYQTPEPLLDNERWPARDRRTAILQEDIPSADLLVAFRPIYQRQDGSYTVVWRVLRQFQAPQITDLADYIQFQSADVN
ncbi:MAG: hypothetical protein AAGF24_02890, partial [Cyanobacteria bacterium P01_H01_bin.121]